MHTQTHTRMHAHTQTHTHHNTHTCTHTHMFHKPLLNLAACVVCCCCSLRFLTMCSGVVVAGLCAIGLISMQV